MTPGKQEELQKKQEQVPQTERVEVPPPLKVEPEKPLEQPAKPAEQEVKLPEIPEQAPSTSTTVTTPPPAVPTKSPELEKIENILQEDLEDIYFKMTPEKQQEFKKAGEEAATKINVLLKEVKVKVKKILNIIKDWLLIIPGVNKYFLTQEAKIKADKIIDLKDTQQISNQPMEDQKQKLK